MKKKILALCLVVVLAITAVTGATLAYFTDAEKQLNTFTVGNVNIDLVEDYVQDSQLMPGKENAVKKEAKIQNKGVNAAWVWAEILLPVELDDGASNSPHAPGLKNSLHYNFPAASTVEWGAAQGGKWIMMHNTDGLKEGFAGTEEVNGKMYNKFIHFYNEKLAAQAETQLFLSKVYMDKACTQCTVKGHENCIVLMDGNTHYAGDWNLIVRAYAIQDANFATVIDAWKAYDGVKY